MDREVGQLNHGPWAFNLFDKTADWLKRCSRWIGRKHVLLIQHSQWQNGDIVGNCEKGLKNGSKVTEDMLFLRNPAQSISITIKLATLNRFHHVTPAATDQRSTTVHLLGGDRVVTLITDRMGCLSSSTAACSAGPWREILIVENQFKWLLCGSGWRSKEECYLFCRCREWSVTKHFQSW